MNKKGFTLIELIGVIILIGIIAMIAIPSVSQYTDRGKLATFLAYESSMEDAAKNAVLDCIGNNSTRCTLPDKGETTNISLKTLIDEGFIDEIKSPTGGSCDINKSYAKVLNRGNLNYKFKVCLYCDDYTTDLEDCK
jgi:type IV pilus assembly protein PilA